MNIDAYFFINCRDKENVWAERKTYEYMKKQVHFRFALIMLLSMVAMLGSSMTPDEGVWVELRDGTKQGFVFADKPVITYTTDKLIMTTAVATVDFLIADVGKLYFADDVTTAIRNAASSEGMLPIIRITADGAQFSGFAPKTAVEIYNLGGQLLAHRQTDADGALMISLSAQPKGIYIIKTNFYLFNI